MLSCRGQQFWIGLFRENGAWKWTNGELATYFNWAPGGQYYQIDTFRLTDRKR